MKKIPCLEHEVLRVLYTYPKFEIVSTGSDEAGHTPIFKQGVSSCHLHFGTLVDIIVNPKKYKSDYGKISEKKVTIEQTGIADKNVFKEISIAIEVLNNGHHVQDISQKGERQIYLTEIGAIAFFKKTYLHEREIIDSTLSTNKLSRRVGVLTIAMAVITIIIGVLQYRKKDEITKEKFQELIESIQSHTLPMHNQRPNSPNPSPSDTPGKKPFALANDTLNTPVLNSHNIKAVPVGAKK